MLVVIIFHHCAHVLLGTCGGLKGVYKYVYVVHSTYIRPENHGQRKFAAHMPRAKGEGICAETSDDRGFKGCTYIRGIHQVTMIHIIYTLISADTS